MRRGEASAVTTTACHVPGPDAKQSLSTAAVHSPGGPKGTALSDWQTIDFFPDPSLVDDPYPYFDEIRSQCPVLELPHLGVVAVSGYDELAEVYRDNQSFSSCNSVVG